MQAAFRSLTLFGKDTAQFVAVSGEIPVLFGTKGTALTLVLTGFASDSIFNTIQLDENKRAVAAVRSIILPSLKAFDAFRGSPEIKYYGITVTYGSKNFLDHSALALEPESLTLVAPAEVCHKFTGGEITEDEFFGAADVWVSTRDMVTGIKKVKLTLQ